MIIRLFPYCFWCALSCVGIGTTLASISHVFFVIEMEAISTQLNAFAIQNSKLLDCEIIETLNCANRPSSSSR